MIGNKILNVQAKADTPVSAEEVYLHEVYEEERFIELQRLPWQRGALDRAAVRPGARPAHPVQQIQNPTNCPHFSAVATIRRH